MTKIRKRHFRDREQHVLVQQTWSTLFCLNCKVWGRDREKAKEIERVPSETCNLGCQVRKLVHRKPEKGVFQKDDQGRTEEGRVAT